MVIHSKNRSYPPKGFRREAVSFPGTIWRYFGWLVPGLLVLTLLSFGWWEVSKRRILAPLAVAEPTTSSAIPARVGTAPLSDSDRKVAVRDLVTEESVQKTLAGPDTLIDDENVETQVFDRLTKCETEDQALDGSLSPDNKPLHVVRRGETLYAIARQHGVSVNSLLALNPLRDPDLLSVGQRVRLPPAETRSALPGATVNYRVEPGESLLSLAVRYAASPWAIAVASDLRNPSVIYPGQQLLIPGQDGASPEAPSQPHPTPVAEDKWIDVDLTTQQVVAYQGTQPVFSALVSTGLPDTPTVTGRYRIYLKYRSQTMYGGNRASGNYYYLPDVPYVQYFYQGYAFHGTYWHDNFGQPMSRGCVNMRTDDARWLFEWAEPAALPGQDQIWADNKQPGTLVVIHY